MVQTYGLHRRLEYVIILILGVIGIDQFLKFLIQKSLPIKYTLLENVLWLTYVENFGAGFGIFHGASIYLGIIGVIISIILFWIIFTNKLTFMENTAYSLIIAGALGNAIDRFVFGYVIDFIDLGWWPVFNIADISLVIGVGLTIVHTIRQDIGNKKKSGKGLSKNSSKKSKAFKLETYEN